MITEEIGNKEYIIEINNLSKNYGKNIVALKDLSLKIPRGKIFGFLGPNGAGKTTTIKILLNFIRHSKGNAKIFNKEIDIYHKIIKQNLGYVPEGVTLPKNLTVNTLLRTSARMYNMNKDEINQAIEKTLKLTGMSKYRFRKIGKMSKGQKQRISITNALIHSPELLILDEPTSGLDALSRGRFLTFIKNWSKETGGTVFISSHVLSEIDKICEEVAILNHGHLVAKGTINDIRKEFITPIFDIQGKNLNFSAISNLDGIIEVNESQNSDGYERIKVKVDTLETGSKNLLNFFCQSNSFLVSFTIDEPTLETAFTKLVEADNKKNGDSYYNFKGDKNE